MHLKYTDLLDAIAELGEPGSLLHTDRWAAIARGLTCGFLSTLQFRWQGAQLEVYRWCGVQVSSLQMSSRGSR